MSAELDEELLDDEDELLDEDDDDELLDEDETLTVVPELLLPPPQAARNDVDTDDAPRKPSALRRVETDSIRSSRLPSSLW